MNSEDGKVNSRKILVILLVIGILLRFFRDIPYVLIWMDEAVFLSLSRNLPFYIFYNNELFLSHPPVYPVFIRLFDFLLPDYLAGVTVSQLSTFGYILFGILLLKQMKVKDNVILWTVFLLTFSWMTIYWSNMIYKEPLFTLLVYLYLFSLISIFASHRNIFIAVSCISGFLAGLTSDFVVFLLPVLLVIFFLYGKEIRFKECFKKMFLPALFLYLGYFMWIAVRLCVFMNNRYYPAGVDGIVEEIGNFHFMHLFTTHNFPESKILTGASVSFAPFWQFKYIAAYINLAGPLHISKAGGFSAKDLILSVAVYIPLALLTARGIVLSLKNREKAGIILAVLLLTFLFPAAVPVSDPRFSFPAILGFAYFFGRGTDGMRTKLNKPAVIFLLALGICYFAEYFHTNNNFFLSMKKEIQLQKTGNFINTLPEGGIMAQGHCPAELAYITGKRIIGLPLNSTNLERQVNLYDIRYFVLRESLEEREYRIPTQYREVIRHIQGSPERFRLCAIIHEDYKAIPLKERIYVYELAEGSEK